MSKLTLSWLRIVIPLVALAACASPAANEDDLTAETAADTSLSMTGSDRIVTEVRHELSLLRETHYDHDTHVVESAGVFDVDCSGYLDYVLGHAADEELAVIENATRPRPLAEDYVSFFAAEPKSNTGWAAVARVVDLVPGDIVAWLEPETAQDTGHVMIVRAAPRRVNATSFIVPVWDSVELPHGPTDSRSATNATGIGYGDIVLLTDANGAPFAHEWQTGAARVVEKIALGHLR